VANLPRGHDAIGVPEGFAGWPIIDRASLLEAIIAAAPGADCSDPSRVRLDGHGYSIAIDIAGDPVTSLAIAVRSGALAAGVVADILGELGLQAVPLERERRRVYRSAYAALATRTPASTNSAPAAGGSSNGRLAVIRAYGEAGSEVRRPASYGGLVDPMAARRTIVLPAHDGGSAKR